MLDVIAGPWPWYVAGPLIGLMVPALLLLGNRQFGVSANLRHLCAAGLPARIPFLDYDWKEQGGWNLAFGAGIVLGGVLAGFALPDPNPVRTALDLGALGFGAPVSLEPPEIFSWSALATPAGLAVVVGGGFCVGFGASYAGGCTSGHGILGLATFQLASLVALVGFFAGGLLAVHAILPQLFGAVR